MKNSQHPAPGSREHPSPNNRGRPPRVLDHGGKRSATPLSPAPRHPHESDPSSARKLSRRCALPEQSKTSLNWVAATRQSAALFPNVSHRRFPKRRYAGIIPLLFCFFILHSFFCLRAPAQSYSIDWYKIAGGGGTSTNGQFSLSGTIGQPDASGALSGGNYSVTGGYWALINVVQTPGAPTLSISHGGNVVTVYWQNVSGWSLIQNGNLATPVASWPPSSSPTLTGGTNYLNITNAAGNLFFRLTHP